LTIGLIRRVFLDLVDDLVPADDPRSPSERGADKTLQRQSERCAFNLIVRAEGVREHETDAPDNDEGQRPGNDPFATSHWSKYTAP
jgi:hypothetical protein